MFEAKRDAGAGLSGQRQPLACASFESPPPPPAQAVAKHRDSRALPSAGAHGHHGVWVWGGHSPPDTAALK
ncbi:hypothetical protein F441_09886 [Phytophthora nicotianae CJ01A1]|uniref:Uncharacterized protein n=3 Tax=Phytophthora nicotianae TaxID=4792 RepID=W2Z7Y3_PHYNI|nr:hypothetical protein L917_09560 [Phytophthora nicotianae]ETP15290.1 hypothetical protein F441_09886 [Phytophthora nicotianae CJ01A1]ETP43368.1 hypothetical protein F442_09840 [Phytophthora nicotianae P10297]